MKSEFLWWWWLVWLWLCVAVFADRRPELCVGVPVAGETRVLCSVHGRCVRNTTLATLRFTADGASPYGVHQDVHMWHNVAYCQCDLGWTGVDCNTPCQGGLEMPCALANVEGKMTEYSACGQVFHALPPCPTCRTPQQIQEHQQRWRATAPTWVLPGMCGCPYPLFGPGCAFTFDRRLSDRSPTYDDFFKATDPATGRLAVVANAQRPRTGNTMAFYPNPVTVNAPTSLSICGQHGRLTRDACVCEPGFASSVIRTRVGSGSSGSSGNAAPAASDGTLDTRFNWLWSQIPQCVVPTKDPMPWLVWGQGGASLPPPSESWTPRTDTTAPPVPVPVSVPIGPPLPTPPALAPSSPPPVRPPPPPFALPTDGPSSRRIRYIDAGQWQVLQPSSGGVDTDSNTTAIVTLAVFAGVFFVCLCGIGVAAYRRCKQKPTRRHHDHDRDFDYELIPRYERG